VKYKSINDEHPKATNDEHSKATATKPENAYVGIQNAFTCSW